MKKLFFFIIFFILVIPNLFCQTTITLGTGTNYNSSNSFPTPYGYYSPNCRAQYLILASEITELGYIPGTINSLAFNVSAVNDCSAMPDYTIKMKSTSATALTSTFDNSAYTTVYTNSSFTPVVGWNKHTFSTPFVWDGTSNLLIDVCFSLGTPNENASVYFSNTTFNSANDYHNDASTACGTSSSANSTTGRANIRLTGNFRIQSNLTVSNTSSTTTDINWTPVGSESTWNIKYGTPGFDPSTSGTTKSGITSKPFTLNGLSEGNSYEIRLQADYGGGILSSWSAPKLVLTPSVSAIDVLDQDFNTSADNLFPSGWTQQNVGGSNDDLQLLASGNPAPTDFTGTGKMIAYNASAFISGNQTRLVSPAINNSGNSELVFQWYHSTTNNSLTSEGMTVQYSTNGINWTDVSFFSRYSTVGGWSRKSILLPNIGSSPIFIGFLFTSQAGTNCYLDQVKLVTCFQPSSVNISKITFNSATVNWTSTVVPSGGYLYEVRTAGAAGSGPTGRVAEGSIPGGLNSFDIGNILNSNTTYFVYLRSVCDGSDKSDWTSSVVFTTGEATTITLGTSSGANYNAFTTYPSPYSHYAKSSKVQYLIRASELVNYNYNNYKSGIISSLAFNVFDKGTCADLKNYTIRLKHIPETTTLLTATFFTDSEPFTTVFLSALYTPSSGWNVHNFSTPFVWDGVRNILIEICADMQSPTNQNARVYYTATTGNTVTYLASDVDEACNRMDGSTTNKRADMKLGGYFVDCETANNLFVSNTTTSSADLTWSPSGNAMSWQIVYGTPGFHPNSQGTLVNISSIPYTLTGLSGGSTYKVYIRSDCGGGAYSSWSYPRSITTPLSASVGSLDENFNTSADDVFPSGWTQQLIEAYYGTEELHITDTGYNPFTKAYGGSGRMVVYNSESYYPPNQTRLVSPQIRNVSGKSLSFQWYHSSSNSSLTTEGVQVQYSSDGISWTNAGSFIQRYNAVEGWSAKSVILPEGLPSPVFLGFLFSPGGDGNNCFLDEVKINICASPISLNLTNISYTSAKCNWISPTTPAPAEGYLYELRTTGLPESGAVGLVTSGTFTPELTSFVFSGLTTNTIYNIYLRSVCENANTSKWVDASFKTINSCLTPIGLNMR